MSRILDTVKAIIVVALVFVLCCLGTALFCSPMFAILYFFPPAETIIQAQYLGIDPRTIELGFACICTIIGGIYMTAVVFHK